MRRAETLFLILLGSYPPLFLYARNQNELDISSLVSPVLICVGIALLVTLVWYPVLKDSRRAAFISAWCGISFWLSGYLANNVIYPGVATSNAGALCSVLIFVALYLGGRTLIAACPRIGDRPISAIAGLSALLIVYSLVSILPTEARRLVRSHSPLGGSAAATAQARKSSGVQPNIIDIVLDAYPRQDILKSRYGSDNSDFISGLRRRGFYVADRSTSNYNTTALSLASTLNMRYVQRPPGLVGDDIEPVARMIGHSEVSEFLRRHAYRFVTFSTGYPVTEIKDSDDYRDYSNTWDPYHLMLLRFTPLSLAVSTWAKDTMDPYEMHRVQVLDTFKGLVCIDDGKSPVFMLAHIVCPHPPFVFHTDGSPTQPNRPYTISDADDFLSMGGTNSEYVHGLSEQVAFTDRMVLRTIDRMRSRIRRPTIIFVHSDHGPGLGVNFSNPRASDLGERMSNLLAVSFPDHDYQRLYPSMTSVNVYRIILSQYFGASYDLLPDRHYFADWRDVYAQTPLTAEQVESRGR